MSVDRSEWGSDQVARIYHSGVVPPPPGSIIDYAQMTPAPAQGESQDLILPGLYLRRSRFWATIGAYGRGDPEQCMFVFSSQMQRPGRLNGRPYCEGLTVVTGAQPFEVLLPPMNLTGVVVSRRRLQQWFDALGGTTPPAWLDDGVRFMSGPAVTRAAALIEHLVMETCDNLSALADPERRSGLVWSILEILGSLVLGDHDGSMVDYRLSRRHQVIPRARKYILDRIYEPLQVSRICQDLGVSRRALQYSFHDVLHTNPVAFMRNLRLSGARRDLFEADATLQVKDVIDRWGFWHPSRFSCEYRQMFSERPSETIRRRRAELVASPADPSTCQNRITVPPLRPLEHGWAKSQRSGA